VKEIAMTENADQPTMQEILRFADKMQLNRFLTEIAENARVANDLVATGDPTSWDAEQLSQCVRAITYYSEKLPAEITKNMADKIH
jgi:hypothetical protein